MPAQPQRRATVSARAVLRRNPDFAYLFWASVVSMLGDWFSVVAIADQLTAITGKGSTAAYAYAALVLPICVAAPFAGMLADRVDRKRMLLSADLARVPLALLLIVAAQQQQVWMLLTLMALLGVGAAFWDPVASAALPNLVQEADLPTAQAMFSAAWGVMLILGASLGGLVADWLGPGVAFGVDATTFAASVLLLVPIKTAMQKPTLANQAGSAAPLPLRPFLKQNPLVLRLLLAKTGVSCANGTVGLLPGLMRIRYPAIAGVSGLILMARGVGVAIGPPLARVVVGRTPSMRAILVICAASTFLYALCYALLPLASWFVVAALLVAIAHMGGGSQWTMASLGLLRSTPDHIRGRVMSFDYALATFAIGVSALAAGLVADTVGINATMWILSAFAGLFGIIWLVWVAPFLAKRS